MSPINHQIIFEKAKTKASPSYCRQSNCYPVDAFPGQELAAPSQRLYLKQVRKKHETKTRRQQCSLPPTGRNFSGMMEGSFTMASIMERPFIHPTISVPESLFLLSFHDELMHKSNTRRNQAKNPVSLARVVRCDRSGSVYFN